MRHELPSPDEILEQLVDKAALHLDRLAPVAFNAALDELTRYHRFLLHVNASRTPDGKPFNYASVSGEAWQAPHNEWISQYRRLFERAANHIGDAPDFIEQLAHLPLKLLPGRDDPQMSDEILQAIVDLEVLLIHRIEAWVTKRTVADTAPGSAAGTRTHLVGSDAKSYANLLPNIVGAWETLLQTTSSIYNWRDNGSSPEQRWDSLRASWPFLWKHLSNTAYMFAVSVWNEDEAGAALYRDALVRWPQTLSHNFDGVAHFFNRRLLYPDILLLGLRESQERIKSISVEYAPDPTPDELFNATIHGAHGDVLFLTAALLLLWSMEQKQVSDIGGHTASTLLRRQLEDVDGDHNEPVQGNSFRSTTLDVIRIEMAGDRYPKGTYGSDLDNLVARLDNMTERRVVPGRVFTPSTAHGRDDLRSAILAILLAKARNADDSALQKQIEDISKNETTLPRGDRSLRDILQSLEGLLKLLEAQPPNLSRGLTLLEPDADLSASSNWLKARFSNIIQTIAEERKDRLRKKPLDSKAIDNLRLAAEAAILKPHNHVPYFKDFLVERGLDVSSGEISSFRLDGLNKAQFVDPPMESESTNFVQFYAEHVAQSAGQLLLRQFSRRQREAVTLDCQLEQPDFWERVNKLKMDVGAEPILIVSRRAYNRAMKNLVRSSNAPFKVDRKPNRPKGGIYLATIEGVDICGDELEPGKAWLFSPYLLQLVQYAPLGEMGEIVRVTFQPGEDFQGPIIAEFIQQLTWADWPVYEINCLDPEP